LLQRPVGVAAVLDAEDYDFIQIFADAVQNAVGPAPGRPYASQVIAQWLSDLVWLADQGGREELDYCRRDWFGQLSRKRTAGRRSQD
jgi:hypothetical protein